MSAASLKHSKQQQNYGKQVPPQSATPVINLE
jgi:hypothetical protein